MSFHHFKSHIHVGDEKIDVIVYGTRSRYYPGTYFDPPEGGDFTVEEIQPVNPADIDKMPAVLSESELERIESLGAE